MLAGQFRECSVERLMRFLVALHDVEISGRMLLQDDSMLMRRSGNLAQREPRLLAAPPASDGRPPSTDEADQKYNQENKEANLCDGCGDAGYCEEPQ